MIGVVATPDGPRGPQRGGHRHHHDLGPDQHRAAVVAVGQRARQRTDDRGGEERGEGAHPDERGRVGELVDDVRHRDRLHPGAGVRQQAGAEEDRELAGLERGERTDLFGLGRRVRHGTAIYLGRGATNTCSARLVRMVAHQRSLFATGDPAIDVDAKVERLALDERSWVDVEPELAARRRHVARRARRARRVAPGPAAHVGPRARRSPALVLVPRRRPAPRSVVRGDPRRAHRALLGAGSAPSGSTTTGTARTASPRTPTASCRELDDTLIAIVTLGARRPFLLRPKQRDETGRRRSIDLAPASGDLLVMGGACQAGWEHGVPKVARAGPRISATWRWATGRD